MVVYIIYILYNDSMKAIKGETMDANKKRTKALEISWDCQWDGSDIFDIMQLALEDSNFHTLNEELSELRKKHDI